MSIAHVVKNSLKRRQSLREATRLTRAWLLALSRPKRSIPGLVHVPKTGGTYLTRFSESNEPALWPLMNFRHRVIAGKRCTRPPAPPVNPEDFGRHFGFRRVIARGRAERYFLIAACRNPFDLLVSFYEASKPGAGRGAAQFADGFNDWLARIAQREYPWPGGRFHGGLLHHQMFDLDGAFIIDWVMRNVPRVGRTRASASVIAGLTTRTVLASWSSGPGRTISRCLGTPLTARPNRLRCTGVSRGLSRRHFATTEPPAR